MTAGYSGTPLAKKLGIKEGFTVFAADAPANYAELLAPIPDGVVIKTSPQPDVDVIHLFTNGRDGLFQDLSQFRNLIKQDGTIWVSWYKKSRETPDRNYRGHSARGSFSARVG